MEIKDSGERRKFESGAVRDVAENKGRCDLLPLDIIGEMFTDKIPMYINKYIRTGSVISIRRAIREFSFECYGDTITGILEVSKHFEEGAKKYAERNWEQGIPLHCYIDSAMRHYFKYRRGDKDEPHDRAFLWNLLCALWTQQNLPHLIDLPFAENGGQTKCK